jgi:hypothetical protein
MVLYASTKVPGRMTFWSIGDNKAYIAVEVSEPWEAGPKDVPFNYAVRFGKLDRGLEFYFDAYYKIAKEDFDLQMQFAWDNIQKFARS